MRKISFVFLWVTAVGMIAACNSPAPPQAMQGVPQEVGGVKLSAETIPWMSDLPGRVSAYRTADVRARVDGIIFNRFFDEGSEVSAGQSLYQIDPVLYQAAFDNAQAILLKAQAVFLAAESLAIRYDNLLASGAVSVQQYDNAVAAAQSAAADVAASQAAVHSASINLGFTSVAAPIEGRIGESFMTEGAFVQQSQATLLTTIQQIDCVYVNLQQSAADLLRLRRAFDAGVIKSVDNGVAQVSLILDDGTAYPLLGRLLFSDITVDPTTGSVIVRCLFPNPDHLLLPGMFVRARLEKGIENKAILVPQCAVQRDQAGNPFVFLVNPDNKVMIKKIIVGRSVDHRFVIDEGLRINDVVIVDGLQKIRPGVSVKVVF